MRVRKPIEGFPVCLPWPRRGSQGSGRKGGGGPEPQGIVPERPSLHEVTISHPPQLISLPVRCGPSTKTVGEGGVAAPAPQAFRLQKRFSTEFLEQRPKLIFKIQKSHWGACWAEPALPRFLCAYARRRRLRARRRRKGGNALYGARFTSNLDAVLSTLLPPPGRH